MVDLYLGGLIIALMAAGLFLLTRLGASHLCGWQRNLFAAALVAGLLYYIGEWWYDVRLVRWLPYSNLIVVGNWLPLAAAMLAAFVWQETTLPIAKKWFMSSLLAGIAGYSLVSPMLGQAPRCENQWDRMGSCLQTTKQTCSPACAATMLKAHGIPATEQEMAELCLTRGGTSWQGLYRGLKLKTAGTKWDVAVVQCRSAELSLLGKQPIILSVGLDRGTAIDSEFTREFGWIPGVNHSVVMHGFTSSKCALISDPTQALCREEWDMNTLDTIWRGYAIRLVKRKGETHLASDNK